LRESTDLIPNASATITNPTLTQVGSVDRWELTTLAIAQQAGQVTLPNVTNANGLYDGAEIDIKTLGSWVGTMTIVPPAGQTIDGQTTPYTFVKQTASSLPARSFRYINELNGWVVV
jgi:hypothetical protein